MPRALSAPESISVEKGALGRFSGEFVDRETEQEFLIDRYPEVLRHARLLMTAAMVLNTLFLASDWRFYGQPHFFVALPARLLVILVAGICHFLLGRARDHAHVQRILIGWMWVTAVLVAVLVTSHSDIALFVMLMLPALYFMVVPVAWRWLVLAAAGSSLLLLVGYEIGVFDGTMLGLALALLMMGSALSLMAARANRLARLQWCASRAERHAREELIESRATLERIFAASPIPVVISNRNGRILDLNDSAREFIGFTAGPVEGTSLQEFYVDPTDRERIFALLDRDGRVRDLELDVRLSDGAQRTVMIRATQVDTREGPIIISGIIDISNRKAIERSLERLASTDTLTGLPNRLSFFTAARTEMLRAHRTGAPLTLLMVDLDHFKLINDGFGHQMGDRVLRSFAKACTSVLKGSDLAARLGGEEFALLLPNADIEHGLAIGEQLRLSVEQLRFPEIGEDLRLTVSIGAAAVNNVEPDLDAALAQADIALYEAKRRGRNCVVSAGAHDDLLRFDRTGRGRAAS
ncbi:GGDEF domain-containing protein [Flavisphingomonas formosensis]|uniref:GGDEF domain-containing protein n=1 Tax=Flavisphingomonas formosensis TaxID=861534 RepID=UPI0012F7D9C1|nr:sensor domain-containing diguanylate cyclase [Sphingomonas formosensis]